MGKIAILELYDVVNIALVTDGAFQYRGEQGAATMAPGAIVLGNHGACFECGHEQANKTDPYDAAGLAQLARTGFYKEVHVKSAPAQGVRSIITARAHLVEERVRLDNTIRGLCIAFGIRVGPGQGKDFVARAGAAARTLDGSTPKHSKLQIGDLD